MKETPEAPEITETAETPQQQWLYRAALYELLAFGLRLPSAELAGAVASGEYADALEELAELNQLESKAVAVSLEELAGYKDAALKELAGYKGADSDRLFHELRIEYTHLFVGAPKPVVSPYAGVWWAHEAGVEPLLFVNKESMAVERFMRSCGVGQPKGTNEPLDHISSELEFLQYLCLLRAGAALPPELPQDFSLPKQAFEEFLAQHFAAWSKQFAAAVLAEARLPFYRAVARVLTLL